jgi:anti-sigma factor RsiW
MAGHEYFEELGTLAALGQVSPSEGRELALHLADCAECREALSEYSRIMWQQLPQVRSVRWKFRDPNARSVPDAEFRDRFLARARAEGADLSLEVERKNGQSSEATFRLPGFGYGIGALAAAAVLVMCIFLVRKYETTKTKLTVDASANAARLIALATENSRLKADLAVASAKAIPAPVAVFAVPPPAVNHASSAEVEALQRELVETRLRLEQDGAHLQRLRQENEGLSAANQQNQAVIGDLQSHLSSSQQTSAENMRDVALLETEVRNLQDRLQAQTEKLDQERQLLSVSNDVRQLMGARNLHIIDVRDVGGGKRPDRAFGRVFYAEDASLVFYAFDLPNKLTPATYTFQAWGQQEGTADSLRSLGAFDVDNHEQHRWVLKVNDPKLLHGIDAVFVTAEVHADTKHPRGQKLLYAYLADNPNHP